MATCRSCGEFIEWARTAAGKLMPLDPLGDGGNVIVTRDIDGVLVVESVSTRDWPTGRTSHFVTCPEAKEWRNPRKASR